MSGDIRAHMEWMKNETVQYTSFAVAVHRMRVAIFLRSIAPSGFGTPTRRSARFKHLSDDVHFVAGRMTTLFQVADGEGIGAGGRGSNCRGVADGEHDAGPRRMRAGDAKCTGISNCGMSTFGYVPDRPVLKEINLTIPYGQRAALVGPSGAGRARSRS